MNRRLKNIGEYSKREGRFYRGGSKNMGCTSVRGENRWIRGEESKKRVFFFWSFFASMLLYGMLDSFFCMQDHLILTWQVVNGSEYLFKRKV